MESRKILQWIKDNDALFLLIIYAFGVFIRLGPKLEVDSHLPVFLGDVWYRICMAQYMLDFHALPIPDIRYLPYGDVPLWYPPLSMAFFAALSTIGNTDLPTVMTRIIPFFEAFTPIPFYFLAKEWFDRGVGRLAVLILAITPSFILYSSIADPQVFTLMVIPIVLIYLSRQQYDYSRNTAIWVGILLGITFMTHLSYFIIIGLIALYIIARKVDRHPIRNELRFAAVSVGVSLLISAWWWLPDMLFYWWIFIITTSTLLQTFGSHLTSYGAPFMILGFLGFGYILVNRLSYFNDRSNQNTPFAIALALLFSVLCGIFMGKTVTIPVIAILGLLYGITVVVTSKSSWKAGCATGIASSAIITAIGAYFAHNAGNVGAWTNTFIRVQTGFGSDLSAVGLLFGSLAIFLLLAVALTPIMRQSPESTPIFAMLSCMAAIAITYAGAGSSTMGFVSTLRTYAESDQVLTILSLISIPTLFVYQYNGKVSKYISNHRYETFLVFWTIFMLYEVFSENILSIVREYGLMWETTVRPLEGYRFYIFLAQPFALLGALLITEVRKHRTAYTTGFVIFIAFMGYFSLYGQSMPDYDMDFKITNSGVFIEDYNAAVWFKANTTQEDRIVADYYTGQMFSGVCAGRSLIGGLFPLRNIDFNEYIKAPAQVQDDIYEFYKSADLDLTLEIAERYGITHVYISDNMLNRGWLGAYQYSGFGVPIDWGKFFTSGAFDVIYEDKSNPYNKVYILEIVGS
jgi:hypothetical protein